MNTRKLLSTGVLLAVSFAGLPGVWAQPAAAPAAESVGGFNTYKEAWTVGTKFYNEGKNEEAIAPLEAALALADNNHDRRDVNWYLGHTYRRLNRWADAEKPMLRAAELSASPGEKSTYLRYAGETIRYTGDVLLNEANVLRAAKKEDEADKKLAEAKAKWTAAAKAYTDAAALPEGDRGTALRDLGDTYRRLKDYAGARDAYEKMAAYNIEFTKYAQTLDCAANSIQTYFEEARNADVRACAEKALAMQGMPPTYQGQLLESIRESYRRESNWAGARDTAKRLLAVKGLTADYENIGWSGLLEAYRNEKDTANYVATMRDALKSENLRADQKSGYLAALADALREAKDTAGAKQAIIGGLEVKGLPNRTVANMRFVLASILRDEKDYAGARAEYEKVYSNPRMHDDDIRSGIRSTGDIYVGEENWTAARAMFVKLRDSSTDLGTQWDANQRILGTLLGEKKFEEATTLVRTLLTMDKVAPDTRAGSTWAIVNQLPDDPISAGTAVALVDETLALPEVSSAWFGHLLRHKSERLTKLGRLKEAAETLEKLTTNSESGIRIDALFRLLALHQSQKNTAEAINICTRILASADANDSHKQQAEATRQQLTATPAP